MIPEMNAKGYDRDFNVAVTVTAATTGMVIPPSNIMIVYAVAAGTRWGATTYNGRFDDLGPSPIGFAIEIASDAPIDRTPPAQIGRSYFE